jgi:ATP adenylyltransferase
LDGVPQRIPLIFTDRFCKKGAHSTDLLKTMKYLWSPWRIDYILSRKQKGCIFCKKPKEKEDRKNLILCRSRYAYVMMNRFPYNNGHLMIVPNRHSFDLEQLNREELEDLFLLLKASTKVLKQTLRPHGFNIGINIGIVGGAGEKHLHFHIVPRWTGDTNFMPVLGETKVIPEYLENTYHKLYSAFRDLSLLKKDKKGGRKK